MKRKLGFFLGSIIIFSISLSMLIPIVKPFRSTEYLDYAEATGWGLSHPIEGVILRWSFKTYNEEFE